jgi:MFS family permease
LFIIWRVAPFFKPFPSLYARLLNTSLQVFPPEQETDRGTTIEIGFKEYIECSLNSCSVVVMQMDTAHTTDMTTATDLEEEKRKKQQFSLVMSHVTINMAVSIMNFQTRGEFLKNVLGGDYSAVGRYMSYWTGLTACVEFLLNPTIGKLSDTYGRKPFMMLSPYAAIILKSWVLYSPSLLSLTVERVICDGLRTLSGTTMANAAVTDLVKPDKLRSAFSTLYTALGASIVVGPLIASRMSARGTYYAAIGLACIQLYTDQFWLKETLSSDQKRPYAGFVNPFEMFRLFTTGCVATTTSTLVMTFQNLLDVKIMADPLITIQLNTLKWSREATQRFSSILGLGFVLGGKITDFIVNLTGMSNVHKRTTFTHGVTAFVNIMLGLFPSSFTMFLDGIGGWIGTQRSHGIKQLSTNLTLKSGLIGKGELAGLQANLRALCVSVGPFLYAAAYTRGIKIGRPALALLLSSSFVLMAEIYHQKLIVMLKKKASETNETRSCSERKV